MAGNSRFADRHSDLQNMQNNHRFMKNQLEMRTQQMMNAGNNNRSSANRTVQTGGYQGFREIGQHHNLSPSPRGRAKNGAHGQYLYDAKNAAINYHNDQIADGGVNHRNDEEDDIEVDMDRDDDQNQLYPSGNQNQMSPDTKHPGGMGTLAHKSLVRPQGPAGAQLNPNMEASENYDPANPRNVSYQELYYNQANGREDGENQPMR